MRIEIISGSPRKESLTKRVALHLYSILRKAEDIEVGIIDVRNHVLPPVETVITSIDTAPETLKTLARRMFEADAFILVSPEYNGGYSPAMKTLLDHFPKQYRKVFGIVTASTGALGGIRAAMQLQQLVFALFGVASPHMLVVPDVVGRFTEPGYLTDANFAPQVNQFIKEFLWLAKRLIATNVVESY